MSRNASGTYSLAAGNPVVSGASISSTWANDTLDDLETEMTDSLSRSGKGGMLAALRGVDGAVSAPAYSWTSETGSGFYRVSAGVVAFAILGTKTVTFNASGITLEGALSVDTISEKTAANGVAIDSVTLKDGGITAAGASTFAGGTIADLGTVTTADINGGTIDGANIGASSAGTGNFSTLSIGGVAITSTAAELNILDGVTATTAELNILDGVTATAAELNKLDGVTATTAELNYCDVTTKGVARAGEVWITDDFGFIGMSLIAQTGVSILSGDIDGTDIGATTPGTGAFTTLSASSTATFGAEIVEETGTLTQSGASMTLDPAGGTVQELTLSQSVTSTTDSLADGEYLTLLIDDGTAYTITWPTMEWIGGSAPTLDTTNTNVIELWKVGTTLYGAYVGAAS